jgi:hypothetical protein
MDIEKTKCPACGYDGLQTTGGFGKTITDEQIEAIPRPSINIQEIKRKIQEAEEEYAYWQHFRREVAKSVLPALVTFANNNFEEESVNLDYWTGRAVEWADALITKLKEK